MQNDYSIKKISKDLMNEITTALQSVNDYGSIEIFVQDGVVTQVTVRNIRKTNSRGQHKVF